MNGKPIGVAMKRVVLVVTAVLVLTLCATSCQAKPDTPSPRGSVLEYTQTGNYLGDVIVGTDYWGYEVRARVQNVGAEGTITVFAEITPQDIAYKGSNLKSTDVYLRQGDVMWISFYFSVKWPNEGIGTRVWAVP